MHIPLRLVLSASKVPFCKPYSEDPRSDLEDRADDGTGIGDAVQTLGESLDNEWKRHLSESLRAKI
jgi:hypothetical protein